MTWKHPECPLQNPLNCKEHNNPHLCAFVRADKTCRKKRKARNRESAAGRSSAQA